MHAAKKKYLSMCSSAGTKRPDHFGPSAHTVWKVTSAVCKNIGSQGAVTPWSHKSFFSTQTHAP